MKFRLTHPHFKTTMHGEGYSIITINSRRLGVERAKGRRYSKEGSQTEFYQKLSELGLPVKISIPRTHKGKPVFEGVFGVELLYSLRVTYCRGIVQERLFSLRHLTTLSLKSCGIRALPEDIVNFDGLRKLCLTGNRLRRLPKNLSRLSQLIRLDISYNNLKRLPDYVWRMPQLLKLDASGNPLECITEDFEPSSQLESLNLCNIKLQKLPENLWRLSRLLELDVARNSLREIPDSYVKFDRIMSLVISGNPFCKFPWQFVNCPMTARRCVDVDGFRAESRVPYRVAAEAHRDAAPKIKLLETLLPLPIHEEVVPHLFVLKEDMKPHVPAGLVAILPEQARRISDSEEIDSDYESENGSVYGSELEDSDSEDDQSSDESDPPIRKCLPDIGLGNCSREDSPFVKRRRTEE